MRRVSALSIRGGRESDERKLCCDIIDIDNSLEIWKIIRWIESGARWNLRSEVVISEC